MAGIESKLLRIFGGKQVVLRTNSLSLTEEGHDGMLLMMGYFIDMDDEYIYLAPELSADGISTAVSRETVDEVDLYREFVDPPKPNIVSLVKKLDEGKEDGTPGV